MKPEAKAPAKPAAPKSSIGDLFKKHPKELGLAAAAGLVLIYAAKKKSTSGTVSSIIDPNAAPASGGIASSGGGTSDPGTSGAIDAALAGLSAQIAGINATPVPNSPGGASASAADSLVTPISQLTAAVGSLATAVTPQQGFGGVVPTRQPPPDPAVTTIIIPKPTTLIAPVIPPTSTTVGPAQTAEQLLIQQKIAAKTPVVQGLLGKTTAPRSARGD